MPAKVVLDSSVIAALFFPEENSDWAEKVVRNHDVLITADLAYAEVGNVAWKRIALFKQDRDAVAEALAECLHFIREAVDIVRVGDIAGEALGMALRLGITFYDAVYVAIAHRESAALATLDRKLAERVRGVGVGLLTPF